MAYIQNSKLISNLNIELTDNNDNSSILIHNPISLFGMFMVFNTVSMIIPLWCYVNRSTSVDKQNSNSIIASTDWIKLAQLITNK